MGPRPFSMSCPLASFPALKSAAALLLAALGATSALGDCPVGLDTSYGVGGVAYHDFGEAVVLGGSHWRPDGSLLIAVERTSGPTFAIEMFDAAGSFSGSPFYSVPATMTARDVAAGFGGENDVTFSGESIAAGSPDILAGCLDDAGALDTVACPPAGYMARSVDQDVRVTGHDTVDGCVYTVGRGDVEGFGNDIALAYRLCPLGGGGFSWSSNFYVANGETTAIFNDQDLFHSTASFGTWPAQVEPAAADRSRVEPSVSEQLFRWEVGKSGVKTFVCLYLHDDSLVGCRKFEPQAPYTTREILAVETARNGDAIVVEVVESEQNGREYVLGQIDAETGTYNVLIGGSNGAALGQLAVLFPEELVHLYDEILLMVQRNEGGNGPLAPAIESEACVDQVYGSGARRVCPFEGNGTVDSDVTLETHTRPVEGTTVPCTDNLIVATTDDGQGIAVAKLQLSALVVFLEDHESSGFGGWTAVEP